MESQLHELGIRGVNGIFVALYNAEYSLLYSIVSYDVDRKRGSLNNTLSFLF